MKELMLALVTGACCATTAMAQRDADYTAPRQASASAVGARRILVAAGAGSLRIEGKRGLTEVRARGTAYASERRLLDEIRLVATRRGDVVELRTEIPERHEREWDDYQAGIDLVVEVPDSLALDVEDGSGGLEIRNVGPLCDEYSLTSDWDNQWLTGGSEADVIAEARLDQPSIFAGVKRFAEERSQRIQRQRSMLDALERDNAADLPAAT